MKNTIIYIITIITTIIATIFLIPKQIDYELIPAKPIIETKIIYRDYNKPKKEIVDKLKCYDTSDPELEVKKVDSNTIKAEAKLCEREWNREYKINTFKENEEESKWKAPLIYITTSILLGFLAGSMR